MRHQPLGIHAIAGEPAADLVVNAARRHPFASVQHHPHPLGVPGARRLPQQKGRLARTRELGGGAKAAELGIVFALEKQGGMAQEARVQREVARLAGRVRLQLPVKIRRRLQYPLPFLLPQAGNLAQDLDKAGLAVPALRRKIGSAVKGLQIRRKKAIQRPPSLPRHRLHRCHIDPVHVRPLLPVHLDAHEMRVEEAGRRVVLEGFPLHDVAPVAGRVADAQEDRLAFRARLGERLRSPGEPIDRVMLVLQQVRRFLAAQPVRRGFFHLFLFIMLILIHRGGATHWPSIIAASTSPV